MKKNILESICIIAFFLLMSLIAFSVEAQTLKVKSKKTYIYQQDTVVTVKQKILLEINETQIRVTKEGETIILPVQAFYETNHKVPYAWKLHWIIGTHVQLHLLVDYGGLFLTDGITTVEYRSRDIKGMKRFLNEKANKRYFTAQ